jgi:branched-chain amino acid aminotransferase
VFFVKGRTLHTPLADCFLNGITRQTVIQLAEGLDYQVVERTIVPGELGDFDECFLTGTAAEITPVQSIDQQRYQPGSACRDFIAAYTSTVNA